MINDSRLQTASPCLEDSTVNCFYSNVHTSRMRFPTLFLPFPTFPFQSPPSDNPSIASIDVAGLGWRVFKSAGQVICAIDTCLSFQAEKFSSCVEMFPTTDKCVKVWVTEGLYLKIQSTSQSDYRLQTSLLSHMRQDVVYPLYLLLIYRQYLHPVSGRVHARTSVLLWKVKGRV